MSIAQKIPQLTLSDFALQLNSILELETLLRHTVNAASVLADADSALILMPDEQGSSLTMRAHFTATEQETLPPFQIPIQGSVPGKVFKSNEPALIKEASVLGTAIPWHPVKTLLYIPMVSRRGTVGVLVVYNLHKQSDYSSSEIKVLKQLASHAAVAIDNARTYEDSQARAFEMALLTDAAEAVNATLSLPQVLSLIGKNMLKALQANWCEVLTYNTEHDSFFTLSSQRKATWGMALQRTIDVTKLPNIQRGLNDEKPLRLEVASTLLSEAEETLFEGIRHAVLVAVHDDKVKLGMLMLLYTDSVPEDARFGGAQKRAREMALELLDNEPRKALSSARQIVKETQAASCQLWLWDDETNCLKQVVDESSMVWVTSPYPSRTGEAYPRLLAASRNQAPASFALTDASLPLDIQVFLKWHQLQVLLVVPYMLRGEDMGLVLIGDTLRPNKFEGREINLAQALVLQAANAIKNAQLFEDLQGSLETLRQTQAKLVETARLSAIGELAAAVAHQINNPLTTILGDAQILLSTTNLPEGQNESLNAIHRAGQRAHEVVQRLLTMARRKSGDELPIAMDINQTITSTLALVGGTLFRGRVNLKVNLADSLPFAFGLPGQLEDVWLNIIMNARDAVRNVHDGNIEIQSRYNTENNTVEVSISDNGPGVKETDISLMFGAFYTTKPPGEGTGLGLYICQTVIKKCGGEIRVANSPVDGGAVFTVSLPGENTP
jgi:signal transduction histidine kinase